MTKKGSNSEDIKVRVFRVTGEIIKPNLQTSFHKEVRALKPEEVEQRIYKELGSRHRAKRFQIRIHEIREIRLDEIEDATIRKLTLGEEESAQ